MSARREGGHCAICKADVVPHPEYARVKTHLYSRIDTLRERAERAEETLRQIEAAADDVPASVLRTLARMALVESDVPENEKEVDPS